MAPDDQAAELLEDLAGLRKRLAVEIARSSLAIRYARDVRRQVAVRLARIRLMREERSQPSRIAREGERRKGATENPF